MTNRDVSLPLPSRISLVVKTSVGSPSLYEPHRGQGYFQGLAPACSGGSRLLLLGLFLRVPVPVLSLADWRLHTCLIACWWVTTDLPFFLFPQHPGLSARILATAAAHGAAFAAAERHCFFPAGVLWSRCSFAARTLATARLYLLLLLPPELRRSRKSIQPRGQRYFELLGTSFFPFAFVPLTTGQPLLHQFSNLI